MVEVVPEATAPAVESPSTAELWFDPICPFTWRTSRWLVDIAARQGLTINWHVMSLAVLHFGQVAPPGEQITEAAGALRALVAAEDAGGQEALAKLYTVLGSRRHDRGEPYTPEAIRQAVLDAGLPSEVADAVDSESYDERIVDSHQRGQQRGGTEMGSPVVALGDSRGYFGPVLTAIPGPEDGQRLFDAVRTLASIPVFSEIKTSRS
jgi:2-hydroxychromene-2-carboxylate isomerase